MVPYTALLLPAPPPLWHGYGTTTVDAGPLSGRQLQEARYVARRRPVSPSSYRPDAPLVAQLAHRTHPDAGDQHLLATRAVQQSRDRAVRVLTRG